MPNYHPNVKGVAKTRTKKSTRDRRALSKIPIKYALDVGKLASLELTAARYGFPYVESTNYPTEKVDVCLVGCRNAGDRP